MTRARKEDHEDGRGREGGEKSTKPERRERKRKEDGGSERNERSTLKLKGVEHVTLSPRDSEELRLVDPIHGKDDFLLECDRTAKLENDRLSTTPDLKKKAAQ